jgi:hypothetical protein
MGAKRLRRRRPGAGPVGTLLCACALAALVAAGCGQVDGGSEPFVGTVLFQDPAGGYTLHLLEPPWIPITVETVTTFVVPPDDATVSLQESDALYSLHVDPLAGAPAAALAATTAGLPGAGGAKPQNVRTASGATGVELAWQEAATLFHRDAFLAGPSGQTFRMHFTAKRSIAGDPMISQMIVSFAPLH